MIVFLLLTLYMINYMDRVALSIVLPMVEADLHLNPEQFGIIFGAFFFGYAIFNFLGGLAADRFGPLWVLGAAVALWSIFCGLTAIATGFWSMLILRVLFGMAEGPISAAANKMVNSWFPKRQVATAVGFLSAGSPLGGAIAGPIVGLLAVAFGWRLSFVIIAAIGFVWLACWVYLAADAPEKSKRVTEEEKNRIAEWRREEQASLNGVVAPQRSVWSYIRNPVILGTSFAFFASNYTLFFFLSWFPSYLTKAHGLDIKSMAFATVIPWLVGFVGMSLGGVLSDFVLRKTGSAVLARKLILVTFLGCSAMCVGLSGTVTTLTAAVALMSMSLFLLYTAGPSYWAVVLDNVDKNNVGAVTGFLHLCGSTAGMIGPVVTGYIVQSTGKFDSAFLMAGCVSLTGAVVVFFLLRESRRGPAVSVPSEAL
ncbi:MFS transporter [Pseudomonas reidholzensis]|uniref:MFS transporter n=1 Tax=Pseudomonas reidholzensis TaxID=1785162 RepID=UPI001FC9D8FE|nr:MFS transporter [Pseudomonas reidholzensis]